MDTPRTDAEAYDTGLLLLEDDPHPDLVVQSNFARTLERELAQMTRERDEARTKRLETLANVADERDALRAEVERLRTSIAWRPIETAPHDGSNVLLRNRTGVGNGYFLPTARGGQGAWIWPYVIMNPTHWMPLEALQEPTP